MGQARIAAPKSSNDQVNWFSTNGFTHYDFNVNEIFLNPGTFGGAAATVEVVSALAHEASHYVSYALLSLNPNTAPSYNAAAIAGVRDEALAHATTYLVQ